MDQPWHPERGDIELTAVLGALASPHRLDVVRRIASGESVTCGSALPQMPKSTASHHWSVLREAGVLRQHRHGRVVHMSLRRDDLDDRFPGLLDAILASATGDAP